jgi:hypothetical protein
MDPKGSLPCSQEPTTSAEQINTVHTLLSFLKNHFNIILSSMPRSLQNFNVLHLQPSHCITNYSYISFKCKIALFTL